MHNIVPSRLGGPMNLGLQRYVIWAMLRRAARMCELDLGWYEQDWDLDPQLRLPENYDRIIRLIYVF